MFIDEIHFDAKGLVPVIAQDAKDWHDFDVGLGQ